MANKVAYSLVKRGSNEYINVVQVDYPNSAVEYQVLSETNSYYLVDGGLRIKKTLLMRLFS